MNDPLYLKELLHNISQGLLYPTMIILIILIVFGIWCLGSVIVEAVAERRHYKANLPRLIADIEDASYGELERVIAASGLLARQKDALQTLAAYGYLSQEPRVALAKRLIAQMEARFVKVTSRTDLAAKVAPMIGLMGTLIPLGPGIVAMGQADVSVLADSIEIAFDTTIVGLIVAVVAMFVGRFRKRWYEDYMTAIEACATAILDKAQACQDAGENLGDSNTAAETVERLVAKDAKQSKGKAAIASEV